MSNEGCSEPCGLCSKSTNDNPSSKKRRKLLNGAACKSEAELLTKALMQHSTKRGFATCYKDLKEPTTLLCFNCQKLLLKSKKLEEELYSVEQQIDNKLEFLMTTMTSSSNITVSCSSSIPNSSSLELPSASTSTPTRKRSISGSSSAMKTSPDVSVFIKRPNASKKATITPRRKKAVISLSTGRYKTAANSIFTFSKTHGYVLSSVTKQIHGEMKTISSQNYNSVLRSDHENVKHFSWVVIWNEFTQKLPTLVLFLRKLFPKSDHKYLSYLICVMLKHQCKHTSLFQRVMSVLLYAHGTSKQVYNYLHPFGVCMSPSTTVRVITALSRNYDAEVLKWASEVKKRVLCTEATSTQIIGYSLQSEVPSSSNSDSDSTNYSNGEVSFFSESDNSESDYDSDGNQEVDVVDDNCDINEGEENEENVPIASTVEVELEPKKSPASDSFGYVLVMDNIDMNIRRSFQRSDRTTASYHFCHAYGLLNRIDSSSLSDGPPSGTLSLEEILPNSSDLKRITEDFAVLVSRVFVQFIPEFAGHGVFVQWHIASQYSEEMSQKSVVVPLGVQLKNENKLKEMGEILLALNSYIPVQDDPPMDTDDTNTMTSTRTQLFPRLLYGDQLTVVRAQGAAALRSWHKTPLRRLEGYVPVTSDWHARLCLVTVIHNRLYSGASPSDKGTLLQLEHLINRTSYGKDPKHNMKATEDFFETVLSAYIVTAAKEVMASNNLHDCNAVAKALVKKFVTVSLPSDEPSSISLPTDSVYAYAVDFLTMGLFWHGFHDAIRHGDGDRIISYWKFLTVIFKEEGHFNYAKEGFKLVSQSLLFSPRKAAELKWCRTVNTHGRVGQNVPVDLHMEHLNANLKRMLHHLGSNITPASVLRASRALGAVQSVCNNFEDTTGIPLETGFHSRPSFEKYLLKLTDELELAQVFSQKDNRQYQGFKNHKPRMSSVNWKKVSSWLKEQILNYDHTY